jgi:hypothetical protein
MLAAPMNGKSSGCPAGCPNSQIETMQREWRLISLVPNGNAMSTVPQP